MSLQAMLKTAREVEARFNKTQDQHIWFHDDGSIEVKATPHNLIYKPNSTGALFHSDNSFVKLVMGPYGSGKSTLCCFNIVERTCSMPYWFRGRRRARFGIVRNTSGELYSTTLQTWLTWFGELGDISKRQKPLLTYEHMFSDGRGIVELELIFIALDRPDDVRKIRSLELTGVYINESSETPQNVLSHMKGRVNGRYPSKGFCSEPYWSGIIADTNPPDEDHWIYKDFETKNLPDYKIFHQPPGLLKDKDDNWIRNPNADNANNLSDDYYLKLAQGQSAEFIKVFCLGQYGTVGLGQIVYPEYNDDLHSSENIKYDPLLPLYLGLDFGLTPACIVTQLSPRGQLRAIKEYTSERMGLRSFINAVVLPGIAQEFPGAKIERVPCDPSGMASDQIMEELSCIGEAISLGLPAEPARTNEIDARLGSVRFFLTNLVDGQPAFLLSRKGCPRLRKGFIKDYYYKRMAISGEERYRDKPEKNSASHIHDCLQYIALEFAATAVAEAATPKTTLNLFNPSFNWN